MFHSGELTLQYFYEARRGIESAIVQLAVEKATPEDIERLRTINKVLLSEIKDRAKLRKNNSAFHIAVGDIAGNPLLSLMLKSILDLLDVVLPKSAQSERYIQDTYRRHELIIEAMERKDAARCVELIAVDTEHTTRLKT